MPSIRLVLILLLAALLLSAAAANGASSGLVISQVYAGGGNAGATFTNDYVELLNRGSTAVDLGGWTVQYATAAGTSWQATPLTGSVQPGRYYLVQLASAAAVGAPLPAADATGTTNLAASGGKIALVHDMNPLACGATAGSCSANAFVADLVGYGSATDYEGAAAAPTLTNTTAALRGTNGCADTDANAADFATGAPSPRNGASPVADCGTAEPPPAAGGVSAAATVAVDVQSVLSIALEHQSLSFGTGAAGDTPAALPERVTVLSNDAAGYTLTVHRSTFVPADLPLGIADAAPPGAVAGGPLAGGALVPLPIAPAADLVLGTTSARSAGAGDVWTTSLAFTSALPVLPPGHYTATVTYTVIGR